MGHLHAVEYDTRVMKQSGILANRHAIKLRRAAESLAPVSGLTHRFYRYPARFSPAFAGAAIEALSRPGDLVLDPFLGGGTTVVEALVRGRRAVGCDINSLALFVARVKTRELRRRDRCALALWADTTVPTLSYLDAPADASGTGADDNLSLPLARPIKKLSALAIASLDQLPSRAATEFARCALLNVCQLALNGRRRQLPLPAFRDRLRATVHEMLAAERELSERVGALGPDVVAPALVNASAGHLPGREPFRSGARADLVVTSPPYPGIHILYNRWQVDGRRESSAPYWIANCSDGQGAVHYNFADRNAIDLYFRRATDCFLGVRSVMKEGAALVQLVAFGSRRQQLPRYLRMLTDAGFEQDGRWRPLWRSVPQRRWHAAQKESSPASREVLLVHRAV